MPRCPSEAVVLAFVEGELTPEDRANMEGHLAECEECRMLVSELARSGPASGEVEPVDEPALAVTAPAHKVHDPSMGPVREGDVLAGKYVVERVLGIGGMGVVVAAKHRDLAQRVALKFLLPAAFEEPGSRARFLREARAAASIQSEHVARVMDVGTLETGAPFMVMEYLNGVDLGERLRRGGPIAPQLAIEFVLQACEAIAEAHALGIIHRDLKPANLFLTKRADGTPLVKVLDFGISKTEGGSQGTLTTQSSTMGSPRYMSPEQLRSARDVDARTDVWSLGIILFELVSGKPPFDGPSMMSLCTAIGTETPPLLRSVCPSAPESLERAVAACLEKDREERTGSVAALARSLAPIASANARASIERIVRIGGGTGSQSQTRTVPTPREAAESSSRRNWIAGAGMALAGAAVLGSIAFWPNRPPDGGPDRTDGGLSPSPAPSTSDGGQGRTPGSAFGLDGSVSTSTPTSVPGIRVKHMLDAGTAPAPMPSTEPARNPLLDRK